MKTALSILALLMALTLSTVAQQPAILVVVHSSGMFSTNGGVKPWTDFYTNPKVKLVNHSVRRELASGMMNTYRARTVTNAPKLYATKIFILEASEQSIAIGENASVVYEQAIKVLGKARADGFQTYVCTCPIAKTSMSLADNVERLNYNTLVTANRNRAYDGVLDLAHWIENADSVSEVDQRVIAVKIREQLHLP